MKIFTRKQFVIKNEEIFELLKLKFPFLLNSFEKRNILKDRFIFRKNEESSDYYTLFLQGKFEWSSKPGSVIDEKLISLSKDNWFELVKSTTELPSRCDVEINYQEMIITDLTDHENKNKQ